MKAVYHEKNSDKKEQTAIMNKKPTELASKVLKLNERFIEGDIDRRPTSN